MAPSQTISKTLSRCIPAVDYAAGVGSGDRYLRSEAKKQWNRRLERRGWYSLYTR
jgi:hypothetical protein